ncbi:hypothetical protein E3N88_42523 [Mikania micrantha]|uniref:25S rRNA (uridine-N(3))-methyltransferase BMT5-like domain-containing protein n=1 Tax=Mikania micrantha TaxID=192012 RepID=A0A5N6LHI3_9ASTR|nr:hypothetical protein E3N88_42523 [Mikania micrantha]
MTSRIFSGRKYWPPAKRRTDGKQMCRSVGYGAVLSLMTVSGLSQTRANRELVRGFFTQASMMLAEQGHVQVTHKISSRFSDWSITTLAKEEGLVKIEEEWFNIQDYPGYVNKKDYSKKDKILIVGDGTSPSPVLWQASFYTARRLLSLLWMSLVTKEETMMRSLRKNRKLVEGFFKQAYDMLSPKGVIEVTHKSTGPFLRWEIVSLVAG